MVAKHMINLLQGWAKVQFLMVKVFFFRKGYYPGMLGAVPVFSLKVLVPLNILILLTL